MRMRLPGYHRRPQQPNREYHHWPEMSDRDLQLQDEGGRHENNQNKVSISKM